MGPTLPPLSKMWTQLPTYQAHKGARRKTAQAVPSSTSDSPLPPTAFPSAATGHGGDHNTNNLDLLLEPAVDGPPSPERIRALVNKQLKRDRHQSQQTTSSTSSSSGRPSWEHGLEALSVTRRSSQRSTTSSMPTRERPDSVQIFGKTLFNRRTRLGRGDSTDQSASNSSLLSVEQAADGPAPPSKDPSFINAMFARRKSSARTLQEEDPSVAQRKLQISGPYNFQHLTHTHKDSQDSTNEGPALQSPPLPFEGRHVSSFSSDAFPVTQDPSAGPHTNSHAEPHARLNLKSVFSSPPTPRRFTKRAHSQEQIRAPPPRPPRSPTEYNFSSTINMPPRMSSRISTQWDGFNTSVLDGGDSRNSNPSRKPKPSRLPPAAELREPVDLEPLSPRTVISEGHKVSHAVTTPDDSAWPLPPNTMYSLPDVPEEEENAISGHRSRASEASNSSSLRGSVSVPLLRGISQSQAGAQRPPSNASDTLGRFDVMAVQRALRTSIDEGSECEGEGEELVRDDWEDVIDYCYEHAAEADCDFAWERPSHDQARQAGMLQEPRPAGFGIMSPSDSVGLLSPPTQFDEVPVLSPASFNSAATISEAATPVILPPVTSNFSLPRRDSSALLVRGDDRRASHASSFKESHGFNLSPTLLIPNDYHQQMLLHEREELREQAEGEYNVHSSPALSHARSSASTTDSVLSEHSAFSSKHKSTLSTSTAFTRHTGSATSATMEGWRLSVEACAPSIAEESETPVVQMENGDAADTVPELGENRITKRNVSRERHARAASHNINMTKTAVVEMVAADEAQPASEGIRTRRRARTTSRSHNAAPPPAQFGLFPSVHPMPSRI